jgi:hypothetical protein
MAPELFRQAGDESCRMGYDDDLGSMRRFSNQPCQSWE